MSQAILPKPFDGSDHQSLFWQESDRAALLVHGFPGTPLEQRPDGLVLLAPFWSFGDKWFSFLWPVMKFAFLALNL